MRTMLKRAIPAVLAAALVIAIVVVAYQWRIITAQKQQLGENAKQLTLLRSQPPLRGSQSANTTPQPSRVEGSDEKARHLWPDGRGQELAFRTAELERVQRELTASKAMVDQLNAQLRAMQADQGKALEAAEQQAGAMDTRWRESLDSTNLTLQGVRTDLSAAKQEIAQLEADNKALREANASGGGQGPETLRLMSQYQDLSRRREAYLNTILQRFRDVTRQYRSYAAVVSARRNNQAGPLIEDADFGRIVNALTAAQDDLRQIETLNGQAQQIERRLAKK